MSVRVRLGSAAAVCWLLVGAACPAQDDAPPPAAWSLSDCISYAFAHSPKLAAEAERLQSASEGVAEAGSGDDPRVSLSGSAIAANPIEFRVGDNQIVRIQPALQGTVALQAVLPLDVNHYWRHRRSAASSSYAAQRASYRQAAEQLVLDTTTAYYRVLAARSALAPLESARALAERELVRTRARLEAGAATGGLVASREADLAAAEERLVSAIQALADARAFLAATLGLSPEEAPAELLDEPLALETTLEADLARDTALVERPELEALTRGAEALGATAEAIRASTKPSWTLTAGGSASNPTSLPSPGGVRAALTFSWPLSGNGAARAQARSTEDRRAAALSDLEQTKLAIEAQVLQAIGKLGTLAERAASDAAAIHDAEEALARGRARRDQGLTTDLDLAGLESRLLAAQARQAATTYETSIARAEWGRALGVLAPLVAGSPAPERAEGGMPQ